MTLKDIHLENITLIEDYKKIILERSELTPELKEAGFVDGVWGKDRIYNFIYKQLEAFVLRIIEEDVKSKEATGILVYQIQIETNHPLFKPFNLQKYIRELAIGQEYKHFNQKLGAWLSEKCEEESGKEIYNNVHVVTPENQTYAIFEVKDEKTFNQLRKDISSALRILYTNAEKVEVGENESFDDIEIVDDKSTIKELRSVKDKKALDDTFRNTVCHNYVASVYLAVKDALKIIKAENKKVNNIYFVVDVDKECIRFTYEEDYPEYDDESYFLNYKVKNKTLKKFDYLCDELELSVNTEASYYFGYALNILDEEGVFESVMEGDMLEIMGSYNYYGDMEGIFCK